MSVRIIIDSTVDIDPKLKNRFTIVPLTVHFGDEEYLDGVTITHKQFYEKLIESDVLPTTSQAPPVAFAEVFEEVAAAGDTAVVITVASRLSGTFQSAMIAAQDYEGTIFVNTTPGMTATSFIPQQVCAAGLDIKDVLADIIEMKL